MDLHDLLIEKLGFIQKYLMNTSFSISKWCKTSLNQDTSLLLYMYLR